MPFYRQGFNDFHCTHASDKNIADAEDRIVGLAYQSHKTRSKYAAELVTKTSKTRDGFEKQEFNEIFIKEGGDPIRESLRNYKGLLS